MIELTERASKNFHRLLEDEGVDDGKLRVTVTGGGCAGYEYVFKQDEPTAEDLVIDYGKFKFLIDPVSIPYLDGMRLEYVHEGLNEFFKFVNPHEVNSCGCGVSVQFDI